jgi:hypothetical protein
MDGIPEWGGSMGGIFLGVEDKEFQFCLKKLKQIFFTCQNRKRTPPSAGCTEKSGMFWLATPHNVTTLTTTSIEIGMSARISVLWYLI